MREIAWFAGQFAGSAMDPVSWVLVGLCVWIALDAKGRWWHAVLVTIAAIGVTVVMVGGYRREAGLSGGQWVYTVIWTKTVLAALAFFIVRAFRDKRWNVLR